MWLGRYGDDFHPSMDASFMEVDKPATQPREEVILQRSTLLRTELKRIRFLLARQSSIKQVLVFGSVASDQTHEWSDLDIMVIEETDLPFIERSLRLSRLIRPKAGTQFLVYTPMELRSLNERAFVQIEILGKGRVLSMNASGDAQRWLEFADQDSRMAELAFSAAIFNQTCFHAQQCVEKCLKACLTVSGELLPRTHLIADLIGQLPESARAVFDDIEEELIVLDQYYIPTRYPDALPGILPEGLPQRSHAETSLAVAQQCYERARQWIQTYTEHPDSHG
jgi:HEPN domain-containing protein/predicted nucleotidyltransferase